jgi:hypothetical protein
MKYFKIYTLIFLAFLAFSCSNDNSIDSNDLDENLTLETQTIEKSSFEVNNNDGNKTRKLVRTLGLNCGGTCDGSGRGCSLIMDINNPDVVECDCTGCQLEITFDKKKAFSTETQLKHNIYASSFSDYITSNKKNLTNFVNIQNIYVDEYNDVRTVLYEYLSEKSNEVESVMFIENLNEDNRGSGPDIVVSCSGGCNGNQTCRERYIISTGSVECTCEGACEMTVSEK